MTALDRQANLLGALALVITDQTAEAVAAAAGQSVSAAAALSALHHFLDRPTLDQLRKVLGLTPSGAVRLVDRLADAGLVTRGTGDDGRSRSVVLTEAGKRVAQQITAARGFSGSAPSTPVAALPVTAQRPTLPPPSTPTVSRASNTR